MVTDALSLFHDGIEQCPACGAKIEWKPSSDGLSVDVLHPYDPATGMCHPFKAFCNQLEKRARDLAPQGVVLDVERPPRPSKRQRDPRVHLSDGASGAAQWTVCGARIGGNIVALDSRDFRALPHHKRCGNCHRIGHAPCPPGDHVVNPDNPDHCRRCGIEIGPIFGYPSITSE